MKSFEMFLHSFENMMIEVLVQRNQMSKLYPSNKKILDIAFKFFDKNLFEHQLAQGLNAALGQYSVSFGYKVGDHSDNLEAKEKLMKFLDAYKSKEYKETPLLDNFDQITKIIADANYDGDTFKTTLLMVYDVCIRKEMLKLEETPMAS